VDVHDDRRGDAKSNHDEEGHHGAVPKSARILAASAVPGGSKHADAKSVAPHACRRTGAPAHQSEAVSLRGRDPPVRLGCARPPLCDPAGIGLRSHHSWCGLRVKLEVAISTRVFDHRPEEPDVGPGLVASQELLGLDGAAQNERLDTFVVRRKGLDLRVCKSEVTTCSMQ